MQMVFRRKGSRSGIALLWVSATLFTAIGLLTTEVFAQTVSPEGKIAFVRPGTESSEHCFGQACTDIWVMDADGSNEVNLTSTPEVSEGQPAWSADGTRIAYASDRDDIAGFTDIWVMNADGSSQTNLTPTAPDADNFHEYQPAWAPSGTQIVFVREVQGQIITEQGDLFVMDTDPTTDDAVNVTETDANEIDPAWSPDGTKIAFAGVRNSGFEIVTTDPDGQNELILTGDSFDGEDRAPDWSPDSTKVVFMKQSQVGGCCEPWEIWAVNRDGSGDTNLTNDPSDDTGPSWSPDGTEISFTSNRDRTEEDPFRTDIYVMAAPTTLPPPSQTISAATIQNTVRRLTTDGGSSDPDWADAPSDTPADTEAPRVTSTSPTAGATGVLPTANVTATFSEAMRVGSINGQTFKLFRKGSTTKVAASVTYDVDTRTATLNPTNSLRRGATYKAVVTTGATDLAGNKLDQNNSRSGQQQKVWFFTVRS
jgi:Tol biopolymer transport system component